jgi:hypothetical protein
MDVSAFIEPLDIKRIFGVTTQDVNTLSSIITTDLASRQKAAGLLRSFIQYSSSSPYAIASFIGREFAVDFNANRSTITMMFKQEPLVVAEDLDANQADTLKDKRCNVFTGYVNDTTIIQYGTMSGPAWFDEIHGIDWLADAIQASGYNLEYQSTTKIPQTDAGQNQFVTAYSQVLESATIENGNGLIGPGTWNADGFGQLARGDFLKTGYYIFTPSMASQDQSEREARKGPPIQIAIKLAGAIQSSTAILNVNR